jgi:hypothetical protein
MNLTTVLNVTQKLHAYFKNTQAIDFIKYFIEVTIEWE